MISTECRLRRAANSTNPALLDTLIRARLIVFIEPNDTTAGSSVNKLE